MSDIANLGDLERLRAHIAATHGHIDVIFANAGGGALGAFGTISEADFDRTVTTNLKGTFFTVQMLLPLVVDGGSIILNGSIAASLGMPAFTVYSATKAAIRSFARTWTTDLSARRIRVNTLAPGTILTPILSEQAGLSDEQVEGFLTKFAADTPLGTQRGSERDRLCRDVPRLVREQLHHGDRVASRWRIRPGLRVAGRPVSG